MNLMPTRRMDQALRALIHLARHGGEPTKAAEVAAVMDEPTSSVQQVLQTLARAGILGSLTSGNGGYRLVRDPSGTTLLEIIEAVEGRIDGGGCIMRAHPCHWVDVCPLHQVWMEAVESFRDALARASLSDIVSDEEALLAGALPAPRDSHRLGGRRRSTRR